jgi:hypothetical protein
MNDIQVHSKFEHSLRNSKVHLIPLQDKIEILRIYMVETQKYALLTTNQYLKQMALVVDILENLSTITIQKQGSRL